MSGVAEVESIEARFPGVILAKGGTQAETTLTVTPEHLVDICEFLRDESDARYDLLAVLAGGDDHVCYQLASTGRGRRLSLWVPLVAEHRTVESVAFVWPAANWAEREAHDLWNIRFSGHPDLRPLLLRTDLETPPAGEQANNALLAVGFRYPAGIEGAFVLLQLDNTQVIEAQPQLGYRHSGIERQLTRWPCERGILLAGRIDGFSAMHGDLAYALAIERLLDFHPPPRAQMLRAIYAELQRIASHLYWLTRSVQNLSDPSLAAPDYAWETRTAILELFQWLGGNPITPDLLAIGGLNRDVPSTFVARMDVLLTEIAELLDDLDQTLTRSAAFRSQLEGVGVLDPGTALGLGVTGPSVRASGIGYDVRRAFPYAGYESLDLQIPVERGCDADARYLVRMAEIQASVDLIRQALSQLPGGPVNANARGSALPVLPAGMTYASVEGARGELGVLLISDGSACPRWVHIRGPSFCNLSALPFVTRRLQVHQVQTALDSLDISMAEVER